jgi:hypothetical protein
MVKKYEGEVKYQSDATVSGWGTLSNKFIILEGNLLKPGNPYCGMTNRLTNRPTNQLTN